MTNQERDLPEEIIQRVLSFCSVDADGSMAVEDMRGLVAFILENADTYPALRNLVSVNKDALTKHIEETGEVPPGVKLIKTTTIEGSNVTSVRIVHGPANVDRDS